MAESDGFKDWYLGYEVVLKTVNGETVEGTVFAFDKDIQCVVVASPSAQPGSSHVKVLRLDFIQEVVSSKAPEKPFDSTLPAVDPKRVAAREAKALQKAEALVASIGVGVTAEGQAVFDTLHKTMPARWVGPVIEVMDEVLIQPPYSPKECALKTESGNRAILERVCHILEAEAARVSTTGSA